MIWRSLPISAIAFSVVLSMSTIAEPVDEQQGAEVVTIPLDQIWAYDMPGTRDIGKLEINKAPNYAYGPLFGQMRLSLADGLARSEDAKQGFAVLGTGLDALREAHSVLAANQESRTTLPAGREISLVFFSYQFAVYVHLHHVEHRGNVVEIYFHFVPHETMDSTEHRALIPLGTLPKGKYCVKILRSPMAKKHVDLGFQAVSDEDARRVVCRSFSFSVAE